MYASALLVVCTSALIINSVCVCVCVCVCVSALLLVLSALQRCVPSQVLLVMCGWGGGGGGGEHVALSF